MAITKGSKESRLIKIMKAPLKALIKVRDFYIQSMTECSGRFDYGTVMGCPTAQVTASLPRSFSVSSTKSNNSTDDFRELVKAASTKSLGTKIELNLPKKQQSLRQLSPVIAGPNNLPKSRSVGIGRIDEDKPFDQFDEDVKVIRTDVYPRSKSYAVHKRTMF